MITSNLNSEYTVPDKPDRHVNSISCCFNRIAHFIDEGNHNFVFVAQLGATLAFAC